MKKLLSFLTLMLLVSCTNSFYHVASVKSEQVKLIDKDFAFENEHLKVVYNFWEEGGRMRFLVFNKTDQPIYIDWSKSTLVRNGTKTIYSQLPVLTKRSARLLVDTVRYMYQNTFVEPYRLTARANPQTEIPSHILVAITDFPLQQTVLHKKTKETVFTYTKENSPLRFGQQLTYSFDKTLMNPTTVEHSFWIDRIQVVRTGKLTRLYGSLEKGQPNALYAVEKRVAGGRVVVITLVAVTASYFIALEALKSALSGITF